MSEDTDAKVETDKETVKTDSVKTGDEAPVMMYAVVAVMALAVAVVAVKRRRA